MLYKYVLNNYIVTNNLGENYIMRIIICDDDELICNNLKQLLLKYFHNKMASIPTIDIFNCGEDFLEDTGDKDIIFLDIEMPGLNGIYVGNEIKKRYNLAIVFIVTSFMEYLDDAMRFHVFRYLSKPIEKQRLFANMDDAMRLYSTMKTTIAIETKEGLITVTTNNIIMVESYGRKVLVHTTYGDYISIHNMDYWLNALPSHCFFQSHRSYIVNLAHINEFDHNNIYLYNRQFIAYLSRRKYTSFKDNYLLYLENTR